MKKELLKEIIEYKKNKKEFAIITDLDNSQGFLYNRENLFPKDFIKYKDQILDFLKNKKNGIIKNTNIFVETYVLPIKVVIIGGVHIAQYLVDYAKSLNFEIFIIDPRGYFANEKRFPEIKIIIAVPKSGCLKTNKKGISKIINGNNILRLISKLCNLIE